VKTVTLSCHGLIEANATLCICCRRTNISAVSSHFVSQWLQFMCSLLDQSVAYNIWLWSKPKLEALKKQFATLMLVAPYKLTWPTQTKCTHFMISYVSSTLQTNMTNTNQMHTFYDLSIFILFFQQTNLIVILVLLIKKAFVCSFGPFICIVT
jgi:hypothetical protein